MYLPICLIYSTGCPSSSGSYSVLVPWSGGVSWVLLRPTSEIFALPLRAPEVAAYSAHRNRGYSLFLLLVPPQPRPVHSRWLTTVGGSREQPYHGSSRTSPHSLSLSMSLVTHLIGKPSPVVFLKVLFSAHFCSFFTPPHSAN